MSPQEPSDKTQPSFEMPEELRGPSGSQRAAPDGFPAKLVVLKGPKAGAEFPLTEEQTAVGRQADNQVAIPDASMSRRHLVIRREGDAFVAVDQGSGNGTLLNGNLITEELLKDGDVLTLGDTEARFVQKAAIARPKPGAPRQSSSRGEAARRTAPMRTRLLVALPVVAVVVVGAAVVKKNIVRAKERQRLEAVRRQHEIELAEARADFEKGKALARGGDWAAALPVFKAAADLLGDDPDVKRYLDQAEQEAPAANVLREAQAAFDRADWPGAIRALDKVPGESLASDAAAELRKKVSEALDQKVGEAKALAASDRAGATQIVDAVLAANASHAAALALREEIEKQVAADSKKVKVGPPPATVDRCSQAVQLYREGLLDKAIGAAQAVRGDGRCATVLTDLKTFQQLYGDSNESRMEQALRLDRRIGGGRGHFFEELSPQVAERLYRKGVAARATRDYARAFASFKGALEIRPDHDPSKRQIGELRGVAIEEYQAVYTGRNLLEPSESRHRLEVALSMLDPNDEYFGKVKRLLEQLRGAQ